MLTEPNQPRTAGGAAAREDVISEMIESRNEFFPGMMIEKPKRATVIYDARGMALYTCPYCGNVSDEDGCDVMGAEPNCLFCNQCHGEFET